MEEESRFPADPPVRLDSARRAFASFQILAGPVDHGTTVTVVPTDLTGPDKSRLPATCFDVYTAWYQFHQSRWFPEVLLPPSATPGSTPAFRKLNAVPDQRFAGFWIDLFLPADAAPGQYEGKLTVHAGQETARVPLRVQVRAATIPERCCLDVSLNNYADSISPGWPDLRGQSSATPSARHIRVERGVFRAAHEHRMFLHYMPYGHSGHIHPGFAPPLTGEGPRKRVANWSAWDRHFGPYFDGTAFAGTRRGPIPVPRFYLPLNLAWPADFVKFGQPGYAAEWRAVGTQMVEHFRSKGWARTRFDMFLNHKQRYRYYPWDAEEMRFLEDNDLHRYFRTLWEGTFDRASTAPVTFDYTLGTTWTFGWDIRSDFVDFVDLFIGGTDWTGWYQDEMPRLHAKGRQVWACSHSGTISMSLRAPAFVPMLAWMRDLDGYMPHWCTIGGWGQDPFREGFENGASTLLYPGALFDSEETFASLRLKVQRNALQTIELLNAAANGRPGGKNSVSAAVNSQLGVTDKDWVTQRPDYADKKLPKDWTGADFATEEPPLAGWAKFTTSLYRGVRDFALKQATGTQP